MTLTPGERLRQQRAGQSAPSPAPSPGAGSDPARFDPGEHTAAEVLAHADTLETADDLDALLHAEEAGKARVTVLDVLKTRLGGHR